MVPMQVKVPATHEFVFPAGCFFVKVKRVTDLEIKGPDNQARHKESGKRVWEVTVSDCEEDERGFRKTQEVKVKIASDVQPVPPAPEFPGYPPRIAFTEMKISPWTDTSKCTGKRDDAGQHRCRAQQQWTIWAEGMVSEAEYHKTAVKADASKGKN